MSAAIHQQDLEDADPETPVELTPIERLERELEIESLMCCQLQWQIAQLRRAGIRIPDTPIDEKMLHKVGSRWFLRAPAPEELRTDKIKRLLARVQSTEDCRLCTPEVAGSSPAAGSILQ